jgi:hypothetical protein
MTKSRGSRGFNLFTPLVGTALVVTAILISTGMIQNDVRMSRTLISSYEISSQSTTAKLIKATVEVKMMENIEDAIYAVLEDGRNFVISCSGEVECRQKVLDVLNNPHNTFMTKMTTEAGGLYNGVVDSVNIVTEYKAGFNEDELSAILEEISNHGSVVLVESTVDGRINVTINSVLIQQYGADNLQVPFSHGDNWMNISIVPGEFSYITKEPIYNMIKSSAGEFDGMGGLLDLPNINTRLRNEFPGYFTGVVSICALGGGDKRLSVGWDFGGGKTFVLTFHNGLC